MKDDAFDYRFTCVESDALPPLKASWYHEANDGIAAQMIAWAKDILQITDEKAFSHSRVVLKIPWSNALDLSMGNGLVYLEQTPR